MAAQPKKTLFWYFIRVSILIPVLIWGYFGLITKQARGINKTVGWAWDITNFNYLIDLAFLANLVAAIVIIISLLAKKLVKALNK